MPATLGEKAKGVHFEIITVKGTVHFDPSQGPPAPGAQVAIFAYFTGDATAPLETQLLEFGRSISGSSEANLINYSMVIWLPSGRSAFDLSAQYLEGGKQSGNYFVTPDQYSITASDSTGKNFTVTHNTTGGQPVH